MDIKDIKVGMKCKQIKAMPVCDDWSLEYFDRNFEITKIVDSSIFCTSGFIILGFSDDEFLKYFEIILPEAIFPQTISSEAPKKVITEILSNGIRIIRNGDVTIAILPTGEKG